MSLDAEVCVAIAFVVLPLLAVVVAVYLITRRPAVGKNFPIKPTRDDDDYDGNP